MKTGQQLADIAGEPGWTGGPGRAMEWGEMEATWSADGSTLCWINPGKWFQASYVILKIKDGKVAWQVEIMKLADREILSRTEAAAPLSFAIAKLGNAESGSVYPEGFDIGVSDPDVKFSLPMVCEVDLTSNDKNDAVVPGENEIRAELDMTINPDGSIHYSGFKVHRGRLSSDAASKVKAATTYTPLVQTDLGKAMLFRGLNSKDGKFSVGWTIQAVAKQSPQVDWSHWDPLNPDKVLRLYDWQNYADEETALPYKVVNFVLDNRTGKTAVLASKTPCWLGKRDGWLMLAKWCQGTEAKRYLLIENGQENFEAENVWLVSLSDVPMQVKELTVPIRTSVNELLTVRRPEVKADQFFVFYPVKATDETPPGTDFCEIAFRAVANGSDLKEFEMRGSVKIRLSDSSVASVSSEDKRLQPFIDNVALKHADEALNKIYRETLNSLNTKDAEVFKKDELDWISKRDDDAAQAVNIIPEGSEPEVYEAARESSLLESTKQRIKELKNRPGN